MEQLPLKAVSTAIGEVKLPGSKSISNRTLLLAALAEKNTTVSDLLVSDDTSRMLDALEKLGVTLKKETMPDQAAALWHVRSEEHTSELQSR